MEIKKNPLSYENWRKVLKDEELPVALVDLEAFDRNLARLTEIARASGRDLKVRLATKSIRVIELIRRAMERSASIQGLMCYSAREIEMLSAEPEREFDDFLLAYPTVQRSDLEALRRVHDRGKRVSLVVDSVEGMEALSQAMTGAARPFPVLIEMDVSLRLFGGALHLGVRRSPIRTREQLSGLLDKAKFYPALNVIGVMAYEAQVAGLGDRNPFKKTLNPIAAWIRRISVRSVARTRKMVAEVFKERRLTLEVFNGGGTGSLTYALREPWLTEVAAGSGLLCPHLFDYYSNVDFEPAAFFALQVARTPDPGYVTCQGGGYVASGEPGWDKVPRPWLPQGLQLVGTEACGEVQTPLRVPPGLTLRPGDSVLFRHAKAGELAERFNEILLVTRGKVISRAKTYRGLGQSFF